MPGGTPSKERGTGGTAPENGKAQREMPQDETADNPDADGLITLADAAEMLSVSPRTVRRLIQHGYLEGYKVGGGRAIRVHRADVEAVLRRMPGGYGDDA